MTDEVVELPVRQERLPEKVLKFVVASAVATLAEKFASDGVSALITAVRNRRSRTI